jgi:hypothetical protein
VRTARQTFKADIADERAAKRAAVAAAETDEDRQRARKVFRTDIADERASFKNARSTARDAMRAAIGAIKASNA